MATYTTTTWGGINATLSNYKALLTVIDGAIISMGLAHSTDTGQLVISAIAAVPTIGADSGWIMYVMTDALQATAPCYIKMFYGASSTSASYLRMKFQIGLATDGLGNFVGPTSNVIISQQSASDTSSSNHPVYFSGSSNRISAFLFTSGTNWIVTHQMSLGVERTKDSSGNDTSDGFMLYSANGGTTGFAAFQRFYVSGTTTLSYTTQNSCAPTAGTGASGTNVYLYPIRTWDPSETMPYLNFAAYFNADLTVLNPVSVTAWDGNSHTYMPMGLTGAYTSTSYGGTTVSAMRWE